MIYFLVLVSVFHAFCLLFLAWHWKKLPITEKRSSKATISIVIPVRNEAFVLQKLLLCLEYQEYEKERYEVIVVDDFSEDSTAEIVRQQQKELTMNLRLIQLKDTSKSGKKYAITKGVEHASFDFILTTDADCQMGAHWLASYSGKIHHHKFIAGPVVLKGKGLFSSLQQMEFSALIGYGAITLENNSPSMCSGANLGFDKQAFFEVGGYANNIHIPSGDDEFLLFNIQKKYPSHTSFLKNKAAMVVTNTHTSIYKFMNQRIRWTSKWKYNKNPDLRWTAVLFFFEYVCFLWLSYETIAGHFSIVHYLILMTLHAIALAMYIVPIQRFMGLKTKWPALILLQIIYPFHVIFMGVNSIFGNYTWKGRKY